MPRPNCTSCDHFDALDKCCRFNPPVPMMIPGPKGLQVMSVSPPIDPDKWCGHHSKYGVVYTTGS